MPYSVSKRLKAGTEEHEFIVVDSNGTIAPPPYGGPFAKEAEAIAAREYLKKLTIDEWFSLYPENQRDNHMAGHGRVCYIAPDGRWIQHRGRGNYGVHHPVELELEIGEVVRIDQTGEIEIVDRTQDKRLGFSRIR